MLDSRVHPRVQAWLVTPGKSMWCDGRVFAGASTARIAVRDPATTAVVASVPDAAAEDVEHIVATAATAMKAGAWSGSTPSDRERCLLRLADLVDSNGDELQHLIVVENGKLLSAARREVDGSVRFIRYAAGWATKIAGETLDVNFEQPGTRFLAYTRREPIGVVAGIIPWNMPLSMAVWKAVPALACGCAVVIKPAEETPLSALRLAELATEAGVPAGWLSVVTGGARAGAALVAHPLVAKVSFTGSTEVGRLVAQTAGARLARASLELGGKSPVMVFGDVDAASVASAVAQGIFYNQGQVCAAGSRLYVHRLRFDEMVERVGQIAASLTLGSGFDTGAQLGPLVSEAQRERVLGYIQGGRAGGARTVVGGGAPNRPGYFVEPTVFTDARADLAIVREEIFGPVLVAQPFDDEDELVAAVNGTEYGLSASLYTQDLSRAHRLIPRIKAGMVFVNSPARTDPNLPFGGVKASGMGREHGSSMIDLYTELKSVVIGYRT
ncbi:MAG: aldehyde dehydrogenase family protein [Acidobacteriota bacterium]|nr:aldehyde dehydrogenase family protein [Acidobacteriota bacterium]